MAEENDEYLEAAKNNDLVQVADALGDKLYILCGTIISHGLQHKIVEVFEEIHRSNMSKLDADGKPIYREDGKVMKSELYFLPDIERILFYLSNNKEEVKKYMTSLRTEGYFRVSEELHKKFCQNFPNVLLIIRIF